MADLNDDGYPRNGCMDRKYFHKCKSYLINAMRILKGMNNMMILNAFIKKREINSMTFAYQIFHSRYTNEIIRWLKQLLDTTFTKYGLIHIWSTVWVSNSGKVEYSFLFAKVLKHFYF